MRRTWLFGGGNYRGVPFAGLTGGFQKAPRKQHSCHEGGRVERRRANEKRGKRKGEVIGGKKKALIIDRGQWRGREVEMCNLHMAVGR